LTPKQAALLSGLGLILGVVLLLVGYARYVSECFPIGEASPIACTYPSEPVDIAIDTLSLLLLMVSSAFLIRSLRRPSGPAGGSKKAPGPKAKGRSWISSEHI